MIYNNIEFFQIPDYDKYYISKCGQILSTNRTKKILAPGRNNDGYLATTITNNNNLKKTVKIHRLICSTFLPDYSEDLCVDHKDNNKTNNNLSNLRMVTKTQNSRNVLKHEGVIYRRHNNEKRWIAQWYENKRQSKSFSVKIYGDFFAYVLATDYRKEMVDKFYDRPN